MVRKCSTQSFTSRLCGTRLSLTFTIVGLVVVLEVLEVLSSWPFLASLVGWGVGGVLGGHGTKSMLPGRHHVLLVRWLSTNTAGITFGRVILVRREYHTRVLEAHERQHTRQYEQLGSFGFFLIYALLYAALLVRWRSFWRAYWLNPLERAARAAGERGARGASS